MSTKLILVLGATGAQGIAVIDALLAPAADGTPSPYSIRALTRDPDSRRAKELAARGVQIFKGDATDLPSVAAALRGVYGAWINTDGFTLGEQREIFAGMRIFELAKQAGTVRHYVWSSLPYAFKKGGYKDIYKVDHLDAKGRVGEWLEMQESVVSDDNMSWTSVVTGPYLEMFNSVSSSSFQPRICQLTCAMFQRFVGPTSKLADGTFVFAHAMGDGHAPFVALPDIGFFARYTFDNRESTSAQTLDIASDMVNWDQLVETFIRVTGQKAVYKRLTIEEWVQHVPDKDKPIAVMGGPGSTTWGQNFSNFFRLFRDDLIGKDMEWVRKVNPNGYTLEKWMRETEYDGNLRQPVLKIVEDERMSN
ncbi:NAD-P-binding protein [Artomyces pyxidatus]|uniref:NAD-P-binding protein n=1 Tax=Artomyces pyxidatus TaxID=48021 RepID=A0ACB8STK7_9AGAM|nr:NAD-P-binding protein [Artomyces pyxidatus]